MPSSLSSSPLASRVPEVVVLQTTGNTDFEKSIPVFRTEIDSIAGTEVNVKKMGNVLEIKKLPIDLQKMHTAIG